MLPLQEQLLQTSTDDATVTHTVTRLLRHDHVTTADSVAFLGLAICDLRKHDCFRNSPRRDLPLTLAGMRAHQNSYERSDAEDRDGS